MKKSKFIVLILLVLFCTCYNFISVDASEKGNDDFESYTLTINDDFCQTISINCKSFSYIKKEYHNDILKLERKMIRELYNFFMDH